MWSISLAMPLSKLDSICLAKPRSLMQKVYQISTDLQTKRYNKFEICLSQCKISGNQWLDSPIFIEAKKMDHFVTTTLIKRIA